MRTWKKAAKRTKQHERINTKGRLPLKVEVPWSWRLLQVEYLDNLEADTCYNAYILILTTLKLTLVTMYIFLY